MSILATKLFIPPFNPNLVLRQRLLQRLEDGLRFGRKLTVISAPAGFGKTTLAVEWLSSLYSRSTHHEQKSSDDQHTEVKAAWLSLDKSDDDLTDFLGYLVIALQKVMPEVGRATLNSLESAVLPATDALVTPLINDLAAIPIKVILVLDDYHMIEEAAIHEAVTFLLDHQPPQLHIMITTRQDPLLPLSRWRARGQLTEIRQNDLRFSDEEASDFLNRSMGLHLTAEEISTLDAHTEGWIAGLQLAAISLQAEDCSPGCNHGSFIRSFTGNDRHVMDYLVEEVLCCQSSSIQEFLLQTSILGRFNAQLCDVIVEKDGADVQDQPTLQTGPSSAILEYLEKSNLFLIPLDNRRDWYRYHHLFTELLQHRLKIEKGADFLTSLHRKAAHWYAEAGFTNDAVRHAREARDYTWLADLLEKLIQRPSTWSRGEMTQLMHWLDVLPEYIFEGRPSLAMQAARAFFLNSRTIEGETWLARGEAAINAWPSSPEKDHLLGIAYTNRSTFASIRDDAPEAIRMAEKALSLLPPEDKFHISRAMYSLAIGTDQMGDTQEAGQLYEQTAEMAFALGNAFTGLGAMGCQAMILTRQGKLRQAEQICRKGMELGTVDGKLIPTAMQVTFSLGQVQYERNELEACEKTFLDSYALGEQGGIGIVTSADTWLPMLTWARLACGNRPGALDALQQFNNHMVTAASSRKHQVLDDAISAHLALDIGETAQAVAWARKYEDIRQCECCLEVADLVLARVYLYENRPNEALSLLDEIRSSAEQHDNGRYVIEVLILKTLALQRLNRAEIARESLRKAVEIAAPEGYVRLFTAEGSAIASLLSVVRQSSPEAWVIRFIDQVLNEIPSEGDTAARAVRPQQDLIEPLSDRELEVLQMMASGYSIAEIANKLYLSTNTLKAHTQNIYGKLDVHSRMQAVVKARELGLLS